MPNVKYKVRDFFDVHLGSKIAAVHRYIHRVAYDDQEPVKTRLFTDADNILAHALHDPCLTNLAGSANSCTLIFPKPKSNLIF